VAGCLGGGTRSDKPYLPAPACVHHLSQSLLPMVEPNDIVFGGWDISGLNMADSMERAQVLDWELQKQLVPLMKDMQPLPGIFDASFIAANQVRGWRGGRATRTHEHTRTHARTSRTYTPHGICGPALIAANQLRCDGGCLHTLHTCMHAHTQQQHNVRAHPPSSTHRRTDHLFSCHKSLSRSVACDPKRALPRATAGGAPAGDDGGGGRRGARGAWRLGGVGT
jgi:hypothetical protein